MLVRSTSILVLILLMGLLIAPFFQYNHTSTQNDLNCDSAEVQPIATLADTLYTKMLTLENVNDTKETDLIKLSKSIEKYSKQYNIDPYIIIAKGYVESRLNKYAISSNGSCIGIFQLHQWVHNLDPNLKYDEDYQTNKACEILSYFLKIHNGNMTLGLNGYNGYASYSNPYYDKVMNIYNKIK